MGGSPGPLPTPRRPVVERRASAADAQTRGSAQSSPTLFRVPTKIKPAIAEAGKRLWFQRICTNEFEGPGPACFCEEVGGHVHQMIDPNIAVIQIFGRSIEGPVDHARCTYDVLAGNQAPNPAVVRVF